MARGHRLNIFVVLAAVHGILGLPGRSARSNLHSFAPFPSVPVKVNMVLNVLRNHKVYLASVDVKQNVYFPGTWVRLSTTA